MTVHKKLVVLTGAGISAESGIRTFRDSGGLWEGHDVMQVASPEGWKANRSLVLEFYNQRRKQARECRPNDAHLILAKLESFFDIKIITQNVDDLHEKAGSTNILHLHGELNKAQSSVDPKLIYELDHWEIREGDTCEKGSQLRPHIVWFGEDVPKMTKAVKIAMEADIFLIIGTSLQVYPAASLIHYAPEMAELILIDPNTPAEYLPNKVHCIPKKATEGMKIVEKMLLENLTQND